MQVLDANHNLEVGVLSVAQTDESETRVMRQAAVLDSSRGLPLEEHAAELGELRETAALFTIGRASIEEKRQLHDAQDTYRFTAASLGGRVVGNVFEFKESGAINEDLSVAEAKKGVDETVEAFLEAEMSSRWAVYNRALEALGRPTYDTSTEEGRRHIQALYGHGFDPVSAWRKSSSYFWEFPLHPPDAWAETIIGPRKWNIGGLVWGRLAEMRAVTAKKGLPTPTDVKVVDVPINREKIVRLVQSHVATIIGKQMHADQRFFTNELQASTERALPQSLALSRRNDSA